MDLKVILVMLHFMVARSLLLGKDDSTNKILAEAIRGGQPAKIKDFPFLVSMNYILGHYNYGHMCCGFLLTPSWVGTAAHCIVLKTKYRRATTTYRTTLFFLIAGTADRKKMDSLYQLRFPEYFVPHPDFKWSYLYNDVGLIKV
ncbi:hypothetical protein J437_LFUL010632 [Ladona fulva]|uniref:Peptidase S1 domain-containing protein n=1 Tax=Ladona fulva TaxID=123851 RepID=A0A8K0K847_LADFU|nr:hypothetical protein J437_LFUL010632 [Ladona fulva]